MPFHVVGSTVKLLINGSADGQAVNNVLHYKYSGTAPTAAALTTFINAWLTAFQTEWLATHGANYALQSVQATDIASAVGATASVPIVGPGNTGTFTAGAALPNNVAVAVTLRTGLTGRRKRGRVFLGGLNVNQVINDAVPSTMQSVINTLFAHLISLTVSSVFDLAVASILNLTSEVITGYTLNTTSDSMRRRLPGRGA